MRGEIRDSQGKLIPNAKIRLRSKGAAFFSSGSSGTFGIPIPLKADTMTVISDGYDTLIQSVTTASFQTLVLTTSQRAAPGASAGRMSLTKSHADDRPNTTVAFGGETYTSLAENSFVAASDAPETRIALNINNASYSNIRRFLNMKLLVPPDGVRIEEMLNYFNLNQLPAAADEAANEIKLSSKLTTCPWQANHQLLFVNAKAPKISIENTPPAKLIFLIDVSGSMDKDNRLPLVQSAFKFLVNNLRAEDTVGIVTYGGYVGIALEPTSGAEKQKIDSVIDELHADGDTPGSQAVQTAYELSQQIFDVKSNNRVILATDGDFNIGQVSDKELEAIVSRYKDQGIYLTCLGTGMGNYKNSRLETLAKKGNGNFAYIDNVREAQKTMVTEFAKNMYSVAEDTKLDVHFDSKAVKRYRLIGYDNRKEALSDTTLMDGGELGSGQSIMAVFEIEPANEKTNNVATAELRYRLSQNGTEKLVSAPVENRLTNLDSADARWQLAAAVCMFGTLLKHSQYANDISWQMVEDLAKKACNRQDVSENEFLQLIPLAQTIYSESAIGKKKKN